MYYFYFSLRTIIVFLLLMLIIRILGKREVGELSIFDLVILLIIADIGAMGIDDSGLFLASVLCLFVLLILQKFFSKLLIKIPFLRNFIDGKPRVLIKKGEVNYKNLKKENYTIDDLFTQIRNEGIMQINEVTLAIIETSGKLSVFSKKRYEKVILPIILSGRIDKDMAKELNIGKDEILQMLEDENIILKDVLYATSDGIKILDINLRN